MKNTFGNSVTITLFGESHGSAIGAVLDGMAPGIDIDEGFIESQMELRRSVSAISTQRSETDKVKILSGVCNGKTTGTPISFIIENQDTRSKDYSILAEVARPGHADYTAYEKYHGFSDVRGGGHFSGRITAALCAAGAVALSALKAKGITVGTHISRCAGIEDRGFSDNIEADIKKLGSMPFAVLDQARGKEMMEAIERAKLDGDSVGGILESAICGMPTGVGEPWFDTLESMIAHILFAIPAVKGVEFGGGFSLCDMRGSEANDSFSVKDGNIVTDTNRCGGILGGISDGMPIIVRTAIKPTASIFKEQNTVNFIKREECPLKLSGRHDPAIVHRARVVADSVIALAICDMLALRYGTDYLMP